jgi:hypothetical protein
MSSPPFSKPLNHSTPNNNNNGSIFKSDPASPFYNPQSRNNNNYTLDDDNEICSKNGASSPPPPKLPLSSPPPNSQGGCSTSISISIDSPFGLPTSHNPDSGSGDNSFTVSGKPPPPTNFRLREGIVPKLTFSTSTDAEAEEPAPVFFIGSRHSNNESSDSQCEVQSQQLSQSLGLTTTMRNGHGPTQNPPPHNPSTSIVSNEENFECLADGSESFFDSGADNDHASLPSNR